MSMDDTIEVRITAQAGALQTGLQQARDAVASATQRMRDSFGTMRNETKDAIHEMSGEIGGEVEKMAGSFGKLLNVIPGVRAAFLALGAGLVLKEAVEEIDRLLGRLKPVFLKHLVPQSGAIARAPGLSAQVRDLLRGVLAGLFMGLAMREAMLMRAGLQ
jgi:hypothetical protein